MIGYLFTSGVVSLFFASVLFAAGAGIIPLKWNSQEANEAFLKRHRYSLFIAGLLLAVDGVLRSTGVI